MKNIFAIWAQTPDFPVCAVLLRVRALVLFFGMIAFSFTPCAEAQSYVFSKFEVSGNQRIESNTILNYAGLERDVTISAGALNTAYRNILASGLFERVDMEPVGDTLKILVVELPTLNQIVFEGNKRLKSEALIKAIQSQPRRVFNAELAEQDAARVVDAYVQKGRLAARVTPKAIRRADNRVDLVFEVFEGGLVEIERLSFVGNRAFSERRLRRILATKQAGFLRSVISKDTFIADRIDYDKQLLADFYLSRGFVDFKITNVASELSRKRDAMFVTFMLQEGQQFSVGEVSVVSDIETVDLDAFGAAIKVTTGDTYSPLPIETDITRLERFALMQGKDFLRVEPNITRNDRTLTLDIEYELSNGPRVFVERIDIKGNATTLDKVIRRQFNVVEGDPFNPRKIRQSAERIKALGYFSQSRVEPREGSSPDQVIIDVSVVERPTGSLGFGGTYASTTGLGGEITFEEANFLGRGQALGFAISTAKTNKKLEFNFREPAFLERDVSAGIQLSYAGFNPDTTDYKVTNLSLSPSLKFPLTENSALDLAYTIAQSKVSADSTTGLSAVIAGGIVKSEIDKGDVLNSSISYNYYYDTRRKGLDSNSGVFLRFGQEIGGFGGDNAFIKSNFEITGVTNVMAEEVKLITTLEAGTISFNKGSSRVSDRYQLGSNMMRGFDVNGIGPRETGTMTYLGNLYAFDDALGGQNYAVARFEAQFPLGIPNEYGLTGGIFYDVGSLWGLDDITTATGTVESDKFKLRQTIGFSLFWTTVIGPLRFNFMDVLQSETFDKTESFELTIATRF
ncbi:outer membrane protein assembly factor BamA [Paracoccaceae bacterium]|nr:outer membrane protein assembly factor BamA [Paracoccaceae bacterium]